MNAFNARLTVPLLAAVVLLACSGDHNTLNFSSSSAGSGGAGGGGSGGGGSGTGGHPIYIFPDIAALHERAVAPTCSLNGGVCHSQKEFPELGGENDLLSLVGLPCQLGAQTPSSVLDACEIPGDRLKIGGADDEILLVEVANLAPFPPKSVTLKLAATPASLDPTSATIRRLDANNAEILSKSLAGVTLSAGMDAQHVVLNLGAAMDPTLASFLDPRAWDGERVRMGDPNNNGKAHIEPIPWGEIVPGDPARSLFYKRLLDDQYGPQMPLIQRAWTPEATRAVWCWIRGMPPSATSMTLGLHDPIEYESCPLDPAAPDPNAAGGWPSVRTLIGSKCATANCHASDAHSAGLDLTPDAATFQKNVIGVTSTQTPGTMRVVPGQPAASYLLCKVDPMCPSRAMKTALMPQNGTPLSDQEIKIIADWILNGAPTQ